MAEKKNPLKQVKVEVRPAPPALKVVLILLILFSIAALIALRWVHNGIRQETEDLKSEAAAVEEANSELETKADEVDSVDGVKDIAESELGLVDPDTVIIDPQS